MIAVLIIFKIILVAVPAFIRVDPAIISGPTIAQGMSGLKGAFRKVCKAFVTNGTFAPGTWNSSSTFGDPDDHVKNIAAAGFYIYSDSIASQSQSDREMRIAPSIYIAAKDAGAIHSSDVTVYVES